MVWLIMILILVTWFYQCLKFFAAWGLGGKSLSDAKEVPTVQGPKSLNRVLLSVPVTPGWESSIILERPVWKTGQLLGKLRVMTMDFSVPLEGVQNRML